LKSSQDRVNQIPLKWRELDTFGYKVPYPKKIQPNTKYGNLIPKGIKVHS